MENFIRVYDNALSPTFCASVIERFEADDNKMMGLVTSNEGNIAMAEKQTTELLINRPEWTDVADSLMDNLLEHFTRYAHDVKFMAGSDHTELKREVFRLKKYEPGQQFHWHIDCNSKQSFSRVLAAQWYFNTVAKGGRTEFEVQKVKIKPVQGRLALFPVSWMYRHRGAPPLSGPKYICTNFLKPVFP